MHVGEGKSVHPMVGAAMARYFGFGSVLDDVTVYCKDDLDKACQKISKRWISEGSVIILLDDDNKVVELVKVKAWWYVLLRAIREKVRGISTLSQLTSLYPRIHKRMMEIERDMEVESSYTYQFSRLGVLFAEYLYLHHLSKGVENRQIMDSYPSYWSSFLRFHCLPEDESLLNAEINVKMTSMREVISRLPLVILPQGIPGIGKSMLAKRMVEMMNERGIPSYQIAQDDFADKKNSGQECFDHVADLLSSSSYRLIVLARNNSSLRQYQKYLSLERSNLCKISFISPIELAIHHTRREEALLMCIASVIHRKITNDPHPTNSLDIGELASLPLRFINDFHPSSSAFLFSSMNPSPSSSMNISSPSAVTGKPGDGIDGDRMKDEGGDRIDCWG